MACVFCEIPNHDLIWKNENFVAIYDRYPVTASHVLILSQRHVSDFFSMSEIEKHSLTEALSAIKEELLVKDSSISGFNIGMNCGESSGQTIFHFHCHLIPRRRGDTPDPRGGVRGVIADKQKY